MDYARPRVSALSHLQGTLRFGVQAVQQHVDYAGYAALWDTIEQLGLDWASVCDHLLPTQGDPSGPSFEGPTLLAAMAARHSRLRCGVLVAGSTYRHPGVLAKIAATIDHVSGGRLELGVGTGWYELEHAQYGIPFPPIGRRLALLRETAAILKALWTQERTSFEGTCFRLVEARCEPKPLQRPHVPLWIGGSGERVLLRIAAESADGWNTFLLPEDEYRRKLDALAAHCAELGRDPGSIRKGLVLRATLGESEAEAEEALREQAAARGVEPEALRARGVAALSAERCAELLGRYARLGVEDFVLYVRPPAGRALELFARQVAPAVRSGRGDSA